MTACKICDADAKPFDTLEFERSCEAPDKRGGGTVPYLRCGSCGFVFTTAFDAFTPDEWTRKIYNAEYAQVDPEFAVARPLRNAKAVQSYWGAEKSQLVGLDFGGGNGNTAAALRAEGWTFDSFDPFGAAHLDPGHAGRYNLCTAFEVFEHLPDPTSTLRMILSMTTSGPMVIMIGTWLTDGSIDDGLKPWPYAAPRNGHISLYSRLALQTLAKKFQLDFTSVNTKTHLLSRGHDTRSLAWRLRAGRFKMLCRRAFG